MKKLSPSILDVPKLNLVNYVNQLIEWGITNVHYDIMDGIFVPNKALTLDEVFTIKKNAKNILWIFIAWLKMFLNIMKCTKK